MPRLLAQHARIDPEQRADILGSLSDIGVFETGEGRLPDPGPIELVQTSQGWRIDKLPNGVFLDWAQFQATYKRNTLYFVDPTGTSPNARLGTDTDVVTASGTVRVVTTLADGRLRTVSMFIPAGVARDAADSVFERVLASVRWQ